MSICGKCGSVIPYDTAPELCPICSGEWRIWEWQKPPAIGSLEWKKYHPEIKYAPQKTCAECGTSFTYVGTMTFCPSCRARPFVIMEDL